MSKCSFVLNLLLEFQFLNLKIGKINGYMGKGHFLF